MPNCITDQGNILFYVGTVGQIGENGVHVLDIGNCDRQVCKPGQRSQFVLILEETHKSPNDTETRCYAKESLCGQKKMVSCVR